MSYNSNDLDFENNHRDMYTETGVRGNFRERDDRGNYEEMGVRGNYEAWDMKGIIFGLIGVILTSINIKQYASLWLSHYKWNALSGMLLIFFAPFVILPLFFIILFIILPFIYIISKNYPITLLVHIIILMYSFYLDYEKKKEPKLT